MDIIFIDTDLLIDYFRKKDKEETRLFHLAAQFEIAVSSIVAYEFLRGQKGNKIDDFLNQFFTQAAIFSFDFACAQKAAEIWSSTKPTGKSIEPEDLLIAATAITWDYPLATNNRKHVEHIPGIRLL
ncbi:MAG: type II toxin-antitoxin system VapC family toxin [Saprospiraceae bacterium]